MNVWTLFGNRFEPSKSKINSRSQLGQFKYELDARWC